MQRHIEQAEESVSEKPYDECGDEGCFGVPRGHADEDREQPGE